MEDRMKGVLSSRALAEGVMNCVLWLQGWVILSLDFRSSLFTQYCGVRHVRHVV